MFVNITEKPPWGSVIKAITITITIKWTDQIFLPFVDCVPSVQMCYRFHLLNCKNFDVRI